MAHKISKQPTKAPPPSVEDTEVSVVLLPSEPEEPISTLPPHIITNLRLKIEPSFVAQTKLFKGKTKEGPKITALIWTEHGVKKKPIPKHPIFLSWWPNSLCFRLGQHAAVTKKIWILLAPGLVAEMFIKAKPREESPVPIAYAGLQLATAHKQDTVFGYFVVPIAVSFYNYVPPEMIECEGEIDQ